MAAREVAAEAALAPHNLEAEASVLGSILISEPALDAILIDVKLRAEDFYRARHAHIFRAMLALKNSAVPQAVDPLTVCEQLERDGRLEEVGGAEYVRSLPVSVAALANAPDYARIVRENAQLRRLLSATQDIQANVLGRAGDARELLERAESQLYRITADEHASELRSIEDVLHDEVGRLERVSKEGISLTGTPTGFRGIDDLTGGLQPGNLIVLAARPSLGKSALALNIAENAAVQHDRPVALFSLEMSEAELAQRLIASRARQNSDDLRKGKVNPSGWSKIMKANEKLASAPLWVDDSSDLGIMELRAKSRRLHMRQPLGLIVVDYLQLMRPEDSRAGRVEQIGQLSRGLKILARELDVPVLALSQLNRSVEQRPDKRPLLSDLRESGCVTGDSLVFLPETGGRVPISDLVGQAGFQALAVNPETWRLEPRRVERVFGTGRKPVTRLQTALGRTIRATANHKFLTLHGWRRLDELTPGDHIALPRRLPDADGSVLRSEELALLAHMIGDGCALPRQPLHYTTKDPGLAEVVAGLAHRVFEGAVEARINPERSWIQVYFKSRRRVARGRRNPMAQWLDDLGVWGKRGPDKRVPPTVFQQSRSGIGIFLRHLWATDGCIWVGSAEQRHAIYYASSSEGLARDVQALLLRLEINARIRRVEQRNSPRPQYHVSISGLPDTTAFLSEIGGLGESKERSASELLAWIASGPQANTNRDVIPKDAWHSFVRPAMVNAGLTTRAMQAQIGMAYAGSTLYKANLGRDRAARVANVVNSVDLELLAVSDVYWDRIDLLEPAGEEETYDMTVEGLHNFVANEIVVHNSIEQDADVVAFIYREDKYDRESERIGEADIIFAKHRNGPVGEVTLTFVERFAMFSSPVSQDAVLGSGARKPGNGDADRRPDLRVVSDGSGEPSLSAAPEPEPAPDDFADEPEEDF